MIRLENFGFTYNGAVQPALADVNLTIRDGETVLVTGPSGGGKSSLCRALCGLIPHFYGGTVSGRIEVEGLNTLKHPVAEIATKAGMIFQDPENQLVTTDVEREVAFGPENLGFPRSEIARRISESLDALGITNLRYRELNGLSGGEKQKVAIAAVMALHPGILILDEPTSELDPESAEEVLSIIGRFNREMGITVILVEHRLERVLPYANRLIVMNGGKIVIDGVTRDILDKGCDELAANGVGLPPVVRLTRELKKRGMKIDGAPLTVEECRTAMEGLFTESPSRLSHRTEKSIGKPVIQIENLSYTYPEGAVALKNVNLTINEGEFVAVMGKNASGKTTLVKHFNGLLKPSKGIVRLDGIDTREVTTAELTRKVGFVFQNPNDHLFSDTVEDEVGFTLKIRGFGKTEMNKRVDRALKRFGLQKYSKSYPRALSGGEKQRVALASVVLYEPKILVLDEPTRGMDHLAKRDLMEFLREYADQGKTVVLVTHDVETVAEYAGRVILMSEGEIIDDGEKHKVLSRSLLFAPQINRIIKPFEEFGIPSDILTVAELIGALK